MKITRVYNRFKYRPESGLSKHAFYQRKAQAAVLAYYGAYCDCCGIDKIEFLTVDHVDNDGYQDQDENNFILAYRRHFPPNLRILCFNCNCGRARSKDKICPHKN